MATEGTDGELLGPEEGTAPAGAEDAVADLLKLSTQRGSTEIFEVNYTGNKKIANLRIFAISDGYAIS